MSHSQEELPNWNRIGRKIRYDITRYASVSGLNFFKESFQRQGFTDAAFVPWPKRAHDSRPGGALLVQSGHLRDSLQILERNPTRIVFGSSAPYSEIHNQGGTLTVRLTPKSRRFFWYMYHKTGQQHYKWMALSKKKSFCIHMPKRQFIGHSKTLMRDLNTWVVGHIEREFTTHLKR